MKLQLLHSSAFYLGEKLSINQTTVLKTMLESSWLHTWTFSQFGFLTTLFLRENRTQTFLQIFEPAQWISETKLPTITSENCTPVFTSVLFKDICFYGSNQEKKYFSDILDKKCTVGCHRKQKIKNDKHFLASTRTPKTVMDSTGTTLQPKTADNLQP